MVTQPSRCLSSNGTFLAHEQLRRSYIRVGVVALSTKIRRTVWTKEVTHQGSRGGLWVKTICRDDPWDVTWPQYVLRNYTALINVSHDFLIPFTKDFHGTFNFACHVLNYQEEKKNSTDNTGSINVVSYPRTQTYDLEACSYQAPLVQASACSVINLKHEVSVCTRERITCLLHVIFDTRGHQHYSILPRPPKACRDHPRRPQYPCQKRGSTYA